MIKPVQWKTDLQVLSNDDIRQIHNASLQILEKTGVLMPLDENRLNDLEDLGLQIDRQINRVRFPADLVEKAIQKAPDSYTLCARNPQNDLVLNGRQGYLGLDGTGLKVKDLDSGQIHNSTYADLADAARVADKLPQISFLWPCVSAQDRPAPTQPLYELQALAFNTEKHIQAMTAVSRLTATGSVEMAAALAGGRDALKKRPIISNFQATISPLTCDTEAMEAALIFAEAGIPTGFVTMQIGCGTAPATLAGSLALGNAEILAGLVFIQLFFPGAPVFYGSYATMMDLKSGGMTSGNPEDFLLQAGAIQLAHAYKLPITIGTFATGAHTSGWRSGVENALSGTASLLSHGDMICGAGLLEGATVFSFEQLIKDCEIFEILRHFSGGIEVSAETLALDAIHEVGPQNHFMLSEHTLSHMRAIWQPTVKGRQPHMNMGSKTSESDALAAEKARDILNNHHPSPPPNADLLSEILAEYDRKAAEC